MRINAFIAQATGMSRRKAVELIIAGGVKIDGKLAQLGQDVSDHNSIVLDGRELVGRSRQVIMLNKPVGYVVSRDGQGSYTIYDLLPVELQHLKPVGRLDKNSSGLLLLTNDGNLSHQLSHPSKNKLKIYSITLNQPLSDTDRIKIEQGVKLEDAISRLSLADLSRARQALTVKMSEGKNRQIRRTFNSLGYKVVGLQRTNFGQYRLGKLKSGHWRLL